MVTAEWRAIKYLRRGELNAGIGARLSIDVGSGIGKLDTLRGRKMSVGAGLSTLEMRLECLGGRV